MFAKVFGQIFDSSIAEDYNCRRMFMDLLVLADETGAVDMTPEAIARRTNVPLDEVKRYLSELCQPDPTSRSLLEEGKRLIPLSPDRDWGWQIVNYRHYRNLRDKEALRNYFRQAQRDYRAKKKRGVKDNGLTDLTNQDNPGQSLTPASASSSISDSLPEGVRGRFEEWMKVRRSGKKVKFWDKLFEAQVKWLLQFDEKTQLAILDQSIRNGWQGLFELKENRIGNTFGNSRSMSAFEIEKRIAAISNEITAIFKRNGSKRVDGDGIDELKKRRDELKRKLTE